ncbi:MAG TPA: hypothetical protein VMW75_02615, partial [Thermoanaerobaculia bacterium]|nr:hypothetical protein [Thermoanaerobaculia bacterium]
RPLRVRLVNMTAFRSRSLDAQEAGLWSLHEDYPDLIPPGEVWMSDAADPTDRRYFLANAQAIYDGLACGLSYDDATDYGLAVERSERERDTLGGEGKQLPTHADIARMGVYVRPWLTLERDGERVAVWLVKGRKLREIFKTDAFSGGHAFVYPWIPEPEVWIEADKRPSERAFDVLHELTERQSMKHEKLGYDDAHNRAARVEFAARQEYKRTGKLPFTETADGP